MPWTRDQDAANRRNIPQKLYRVQHENSWTKYFPVNDNCCNAFAARIEFIETHHFLKTQIEHHFDWNHRSTPGTPFISMFETKEKAEARAKHHHQYGSHRNFIAEVSSKDLVPTILTDLLGIRRVPMWISSQKFAQALWLGGCPEDNCDIWMSIAEVRKHLGIPWNVGQQDEWLACGAIPWSRIERIMPYDGVTVHYCQNPVSPVISKGWIFKWSSSSWQYMSRSAKQFIADEEASSPRKETTIDEALEGREAESRKNQCDKEDLNITRDEVKEILEATRLADEAKRKWEASQQKVEAVLERVVNRATISPDDELFILLSSLSVRSEQSSF